MVKLRRIRWVEHVAHMGHEKYMHYYSGKAEGKRLVERPRRRYEENIKMDLKETGWEGVD
jgi:hypothetical protein